MVGRALCLAVALGGCQTILPLADAGSDGGVRQTDGFIGGDPGLHAPIPDPKPGCAPDAVRVTASIDADHRLTRRAPVAIAYDAPGATRIEFRSELAGAVEADRSLTTGTAQFDFATGTEPIWTGTYRFTVLAFDAAGCSASARVDLPVDGDLLVGTRRGAVWFVGSNGVPLRQIPLPLDDPSAISALAIRRAPTRVLIGFDHDDGPVPGPAVVELDVASGQLTEFPVQDIQGVDLYPSGKAPSNFVWQADGERVWADGVGDNQLHTFLADGRHEGTSAFTDAGGLTTSVLGIATDTGVLASSESTRRIFALGVDGMARAIVEIESAFAKVRQIAHGHPASTGEATFLVLIWDGPIERVERYTVLGQYVDDLSVGSLTRQVVVSGDALLLRSSAGGIRVFPIDGTEGQNLLVTREFTATIGEDTLSLGAMIRLD